MFSLHHLPYGARRALRSIWLLVPLVALGGAPAAEAQPAAAKSPAPAKADKPRPGEKWVRLLKDSRGKPVAMQTAIVRYVKAEAAEPGKDADDYDQYVDLVGAVHIGDRSYYRKLNRKFRAYDAVLYELVAPEGTKVPRGRGTSNAHPLGALQNGMKSMLEVEHQLEQVDYTRDNMIHADLSPEEFLESMTAREESFVQMYFRMMGASVAQQSQAAADGENAEVDLMAALFAPDRARQLKIALAKQFEGMESLMNSLSGPNGSTLITERNKRALDVLEKQLDAGVEKVAIFYGAGHLAEMDQQLTERFDMQPVSVEWVEAWDLRP
ncbi:MAG: hypothetical protein DCC67_04940 [Planctomycetota bacterium]|nr:MAG: hypothetical protein DCC67_04940 [Planctomycetota bacterium]